MTSSGRLAGGRPTPQPSDGGNARQVPDPAAGGSPSSRSRGGRPATGRAGTPPQAGSPTPRPAGAPSSSPLLPRPEAGEGAGEARRDAPRSRRPAGLTATGTPAGGRRAADSVPPAGSTRLRGAEALAAIQRAQAKARRAPAVRKPAAKTTALPVPSSGASLTATAACLAGCGQIAGPGDPAEVDKAAERHTTKPPKHATNMWSEPAAGAA